MKLCLKATQLATLVVGRWLLFVGCWLLAVGCWLLVERTQFLVCVVDGPKGGAPSVEVAEVCAFVRTSLP